MEKILAIGKEEARKILEEADSDILRAQYLLGDCHTGTACTTEQTFETLCEIVTTQKLLKITFASIIHPSNIVQEKYYRVDPLIFGSIKTSLALLAALKEELLVGNFSMQEQ